MKVQPLTHAVLVSTQQAVPSSPARTVTAGEVNGAVGTRGDVVKSTTSLPDPNHELDFSKHVIYGSLDVTPPGARYTFGEREQRIDAYAGRVVAQIKTIETGDEGQSNIRFQHIRPFLEPAGYFSGGLLAAGYDPHQTITVTFNAYVKELNGASHLTDQDERTYFAWQIAAGVLKHDKVAPGGPLNAQGMQIKAQDRNTINDLESLGSKLQSHWEQEISRPMRDSDGALAARSGKADAYVVKGTLQSLRDDEGVFSQLTPAGQKAVIRTLEENGNVVIPNIYGYPFAGYAFVPYENYHGDYDHRPHEGLMVDLKRGTVSELHGDDDFAKWAERNRANVVNGFNASDRQGGKDAHWPRADYVLDTLIHGNGATFPGRKNFFADKALPVRETFNYTQSRDDNYYLRFGDLKSGIASHFQAVNAKNAMWADQTEVFGASQQNWKAAKEFWGNTFGYLPVIGNTGNIVFGVHDAINGMTQNDRVGGSAAAVISGLQLVHEIATAKADAGLGEPSLANSAPVQHYRWTFNPQTSDLELLRASTPGASFPGMREIELGGKTYYAADAPDAGDGMHYVLRVVDPHDPDKLASSAIVAKPDAQGIWQRRSVVGGGLDELEGRLKDPVGFGSRAMVYADPDDADYVIKVTFPLPAAERVAAMKNEVALFNRYYGGERATFLGSNAADTVSYMRMPKVPGESLEQLMAGGKDLPEGLSASVLNMLVELESAGIAHNDLAARNILYDANTQQCFPVDFGSARAAGGNLAQSDDRYSIWNLREDIQPDNQSFEEMVELLEALKTNAVS
ncbi:hypothetical protein TU82_00195 [Pseudomonas orientalis]|nr:hypothetical protein TU82_00195 [Pseudomonas orientalis]